MAVARPPSYRGNRSKKPRRKVTAMGKVQTKPRGKVVSNTSARNPAPRPKPPAAAPTPQAAQQVAKVEPVVVPRVGPPPATLQGTNSRIDAREGYGQLVGNVNNQARELARQYGAAPNVLQFGWDNGVDSQSLVESIQNDPLSAVATINRNHEAQSKVTNENANTGNTFFSGLNLRDQQSLLDERGRQQEQARRDYEAAMAELTSQILSGRSTRDSAFRDADATDLSAAVDLPPEAEQEAPPVEPEPAAAEASAAEARPEGREWQGSNVFVQKSGSRKGQYYRVVKKNGKRYKVYASEPNKYIPA